MMRVRSFYLKWITISVPFVTLPLVVWMVYHRQGAITTSPRGAADLPLRQPGSPWADNPAAYELPADFEKNARRPLPRDHFPVLDYPPFVTAAEAAAQNLVTAHLPVLGVAHGNVAKAYPIQALGVHELCNDALADEPILASY